MSGTTYNPLDWSVANCPIGRAMEIIGERWTVVVLREVFTGIRRFDDLRVRTDIPRQVLSNRLAKLVEHGILRRTPYREPGARQRYEYRLTEMGMELSPMLVALLRWGDRWLGGGEPTAVLVHAPCNTELEQAFWCRTCRTTFGPAAIKARS